MGNILTVAVDASPKAVTEYIDDLKKGEIADTRKKKNKIGPGAEFRCPCSSAVDSKNTPLDCLVTVSIHYYCLRLFFCDCVQ